MGVEQKLGNLGAVTTTLEQAVNWSRTNAMWPMLFGLACCAIEMMSAQSADFGGRASSLPSLPRCASARRASRVCSLPEKPGMSALERM